MLEPLVFVVILNWNDAAETLACLKALELTAYPNYRVIIVDNGSSPAVLEQIRSAADRFELITSEVNLGFSGGCNLGITVALRAGADYVWLLNNDARVEPDTLGLLVQAIERDIRIGMVGPLIIDPDGNEWQSGGLFDIGEPAYQYAQTIERARLWHADHPDRIAPSGAALLVRRGLIERIGGLDEKLFAYWEDTDYAIRSALAGFRNLIEFSALVRHPAKDLRSSPDSIRPHYYYYMVRNELLMWRKYISRRKLLKLMRWSLVRELRRIQNMDSASEAIEAILAGYWHGCLGRGGAYDPAKRMPKALDALFKGRPSTALKFLMPGPPSSAASGGRTP